LRLYNDKYDDKRNNKRTTVRDAQAQYSHALVWDIHPYIVHIPRTVRGICCHHGTTTV
jgi:hypothetical protein